MEIDDLVSVASTCARSIHGEDATVALEEMPLSYPIEHRFRATVRTRGRGAALESAHDQTMSGAARKLAGALSRRSRVAAKEHLAVDFAASVLGL